MQAHELLSRISHLSLEHGRAQLALTVAALAGIGVVLAASSRRARRPILGAAAVAIPVTAVIAGAVWATYRPLPNQLPPAGYAWIWLAVAVLVLAALRLRNAGARRGVVIVVASVVVAAAAAGQVNAQVGVFPTVGSVVGHRPPAVVLPVAFGDVPGFQPTVQSGVPVDSDWTRPVRTPRSGVVTEVEIPGTESGFPARPAVLYLPPAYLTAPRAVLPVMVMISGQPGRPQDWFSSGRLASTVDAFAARHDGLAPVVVVVDALGSQDANPLCLDSALGHAATYVAHDVPAWIEQNLQVSHDPAQWAIGGFSYGGTCSIQLAVNYPRIYPTFLDFLGQDEPSLGDHAGTVAATFAGDERAFAAVNPIDVLKTRQFPELTGVFVAGTADDEYRPQQQRMFAAARAAGLNVRYYELPGGHEGATWSAALEREMDWTGRRLGLTS
ncbi:MAG: esterase [Rhodococcus sp. (in: high G+C Gram-positive bacteria)]|nr:MAG: esterase [Rhodococcus sp. (in: high G+C Gram-positive bacteria)]